MIYSFLSLPFWPGSGSAFFCGSGQGKNIRIRADPDPKPCSEQDLKEVNRSPIDFFCKSTNLLLETHKIDSFFFLETN